MRECMCVYDDTSMPLSFPTKKIFAKIFMSRRHFTLIFYNPSCAIYAIYFQEHLHPQIKPLFLCNDDDDDAMRKGKNEKIAFSLEWIKKNLRCSKSHWDFYANHLRRHLRMEMHLSLHHDACQHVIIIYNDTGEFPYSRT